jgi:hypothetical protein
MPTALIRDVMLGDPMYEALPEINFGESLSSPGWVRERVAAAGLNVLSLLESGWLGQDAVIASR